MTYKNLIFNNTNQFKNHQRGAAKSEIQMQKQKKTGQKKKLICCSSPRFAGFLDKVSFRFLPFGFGITAQATKMKL